MLKYSIKIKKGATIKLLRFCFWPLVIALILTIYTYIYSSLGSNFATNDYLDPLFLFYLATVTLSLTLTILLIKIVDHLVKRKVYLKILFIYLIVALSIDFFVWPNFSEDLLSSTISLIEFGFSNSIFVTVPILLIHTIYRETKIANRLFKIDTERS